MPTLPAQGPTRIGRSALGLMMLASAACGGSPTEPQLDVANAISLPGGSALVFQGATFGDPHRPQIEQAIRDTLAAASQRLPLDGITIIVRFGSAGGVIPQLGLGGQADAGTVRMTLNPDSPVWVSSLDTEFGRVLAHELHHVARFRAVGFNNNLLEAVVAEGLADQFMVELGGGNPPIWATALVGTELDFWIAEAEKTWLNAGYDHAAWFFVGGTASIPQWAGYAIGFEITGRYFAANPSQTASSLYAEPALSFIPAPSFLPSPGTASSSTRS